MKRNELLEIKKMDSGAINEKVKKTRKEITDLVLDKNMNKLKNLKAIFNKRKEVAKMLTILKQKQLLKELEVEENAKKN
jgi:ribosomal protein L29